VVLLLGDFLHQPVEFRSAGLVEAALLLEAEDADRFQHAQRADAISVGRVFGLFEADRDVTLRGEIVYLVRLHLLDDADQAGGIGEVAVMQDEAPPRFVRVLIEMVDTIGVEQ
jgi:hypothetical protein